MSDSGENKQQGKQGGNKNGDGDGRPKRKICNVCSFPPRTCVCPALPTLPLADSFLKCRIVVLQHPHELRRKNRSLPLVELCLQGCGCENNSESQAGVASEKSTGVDAAKSDDGQTCNDETRDDSSKSEGEQQKQDNSGMSEAKNDDFAMRTVVGRRFGDDCDATVMKILRDPNEVIVVVFPHEKAMELEDGIAEAERRCAVDCKNVQDTEEVDASKIVQTEGEKATSKRKKITLVFLDATWKHAKEMDYKTEAAGEWPEGMIRVKFTPTALTSNATDDTVQKEPQPIPPTSDDVPNGPPPPASETATTDTATASTAAFVPRRFEIRTPPSPDHLSTAECLAWIASRVESDSNIYETLMKPLDYMVQLWRSFAVGGGDRNGRGFTSGDGPMGPEDDGGNFKKKGGRKNGMSQKRRKIN